MDRTETFRDEKLMDEVMQPEERKALIKQRVLDYCKKGDSNKLSGIINDNDVEPKYLFIEKWCALQWAVVNGHAEIVKILLEKREDFKARNISVVEEVEKKVSEEIRDHKKSEFDAIFKKPPNSNDLGKYTPLHWSTYKGNVLITSILLKYNYDALEIDTVGNVSLHQAAASNNFETFKLLMGLGLDLEIKNDRGHMAIDLTANKDIKSLIEKSLLVKECQLCHKLFDFFVKRFLCEIKGEIVCKNCCVSDFYYEKVTSNTKDLLECRCKVCYNFILEAENSIKVAIKSNNLNDITELEGNIKKENIKISCKLSEEAETNISRLEREKKIIEHLNNLQFVEQHKTIEKSVYVLDEMLKNAKDYKIELDQAVIERSYMQKNRLLAEKELRKLLSNLAVEMSSHETLANLEEKINNAKMSNVEEKYLVIGEEIRENIKLNLQARELLDLFMAYPIREYPKVEVIDPKNKNKKPVPPPKKKKKEPPFIIPEWAKELKTLKDKTQELANYVSKSQQIGLDEEFLKNYKIQADRFKQEHEFRKSEEEAFRKMEEEKKKKKKK